MNTLEKHFKIRERGSSVRTEVLAGMTTFATMAYIIILQPVNMRDTGMDTVGILIATALVSAFITMLMGVAANMPIALAPGIASGIVLTYSIVVPGLADWKVGLGMSMISAILFLVLSLFKIREKIVELIPKNIKIGISAGLGIFIIRTALVNARLVNPDSGDSGISPILRYFCQPSALSYVSYCISSALRREEKSTESEAHC